jgi:hypothetical protein
MCSNDPSKFAPPGGMSNSQQRLNARKAARRERQRLQSEQDAEEARKQQYVQLGMYSAARLQKAGKHGAEDSRGAGAQGRGVTMTDSIMSMSVGSRSERSLPSVVKIPA